MARQVFLYMWLAATLVYFVASTYSDYPNQFHWVYNCSIFIFSLMLLFQRNLFASGIGELLLIIFLYFFAFYLVSFWERFPGTTVEHGIFELINILIAIAAFMVGRNFDEEEIIKAYARLGWVIVIITALQLALDEDQIRYGYGIQLMLCLPAAVLLRQYVLISCGIVIMLASFHKTTLVAAILSLAVAYLLKANRTTFLSNVTENSSHYSLASKRDPFLEGAVLIFAIVVGIGVTAYYVNEVLWTIARFMPEGSFSVLGVTMDAEEVDPSREFVTASALTLLGDYFPQGMGYMNFYVLSGPEAGVYLNRLEREVSGVNIHNSYLTWSLEGGILVASAVIVGAYRAAHKISFIKDNTRLGNIGVLFLSWCVALCFTAAFHQVHSTMQFWSTIGIIFGFYAQLWNERLPIQQVHQPLTKLKTVQSTLG